MGVVDPRSRRQFGQHSLVPKCLVPKCEKTAQGVSTCSPEVLSPKLQPLIEAGGGGLHEKKKSLLAEIIERVNNLFDGDLTDDDQLIYVNNVIKGKLLESTTLRQQAANNTKEQFANSPDLGQALLSAIMDALDAHTTMSTQALHSTKVRDGIKDILLGPGKLYEALRV